MNLEDDRHQMSRQLELPWEARGESPKVTRSDESSTAVHGNEHLGADGLMEQVLERQNMLSALRRVKKNRGGPGTDGMTVDELLPWLWEHWDELKSSLLGGSYKPGPVKRVEIPKSGGGVRELGIPSVFDRLIQQALLQVLQPIFDPMPDVNYIDPRIASQVLLPNRTCCLIMFVTQTTGGIMSKISSQTRRELIEAVASRYQESSRGDKTLILDEFVRVTKLHRKYALRLLGKQEDRTAVAAPAKSRSKIYDEAVCQSLVILWEASDRICGKRLKPLLPLLIESLTRHGHLDLDTEVQSKLLRVSASTIDRILAPVRSRSKSRQQRRAPAIRGQIPVRTSGGWDDPLPGFMEIDLVAHCGGSVAGRFNHTLTLTDICSGWTECIALTVRDSSLVVQGLESIRKAMPFPLRGIDSDNGGEFINDGVLEFTKCNGIEFTRSRPYRKNDQAWVEQKNGSVVRRLIGYGRLSGLAAAEALSRLYSSSRLFVNFFQPSFKLLKKERVGARVRKTYSPPATPAARLLSSEHIGDSTKEKLKTVLAALDPLQLLDEIRTMQRHLASLATGSDSHTPPHRCADLERFLASLASAWQDGEVRPTHRQKQEQKTKGKRNYRTRKNPFESVWPKVVGWLEMEPDMTAKEIFDRLHEEQPEEYSAGQIRTLQRYVREWRAMAVRRLMFTGGSGDGQEVAGGAVDTAEVTHKL